MGARMVSFVSIPVYTRYIAPEDWGAFRIIAITADTVGLLVSCQLVSALFRFWANAKNDEERRRLSGTSVTFLFFFTTALFLPFYLGADFLATKIGIPGYGLFLMVWMGATQIGLMYEVVLAEMRMRDEAKLFALIDTFFNVGMVLMCIALVTFFDLGVWGILWGTAGAFVIVFALLFPRFLRRSQLGIDRAIVRKLLTFSLPLIPSAVAMAAIHNIDSYFIQFSYGADEVGLYSIGYRFGTLTSIIFLTPFLLIWEPKSYQMAKDANASRRIGTVFSYVSTILLFLMLGLVVNARNIIRILTAPEYHSAYNVIPLVVGAYVLYAMDFVVRIGLLVHSRTKTVLGVVLTACAVNVAANVFMVPAFGRMGAAWTTLLSFGVLFITDALLSRKWLTVSYEWIRLGKAAVVFVFLVIPLSMFELANPFLGLAVKATACLAYPGALLAVGFFSREEMNALKSLLPKLGKPPQPAPEVGD